jgi:hypothetical protein
MSSENNKRTPFAVKDCALIEIATGMKALTLREMAEVLHKVHSGSIYYHFWGILMRARFDEPEYSNDFASWAYYGLRDMALAERLAVINPTDFQDLEALRQNLLEIIEQRVDELASMAWVPSDRMFYFIRSQIVVFDAGIRAEKPETLVDIIPKLTRGSLFYHFIDARRRSAKGTDDFRAWLCGFDNTHAMLCDRLALVDPYFNTLDELRERLVRIFRESFVEISQ